MLSKIPDVTRVLVEVEAIPESGLIVVYVLPREGTELVAALLAKELGGKTVSVRR